MSESGERARAAALGRQRAQAEQREAQAILDRIPPPWYRVAAARAHRRAADEARVTFERAPVSYTHLTLPTIYSV